MTRATAGSRGVEGILRDELNVKAVEFERSADEPLEAFGITQKLTVNARALGPRLGKQVQQVIQAAKAGDWWRTGTTSSTVGGIELLEAASTTSSWSRRTRRAPSRSSPTAGS